MEYLIIIGVLLLDRLSKVLAVAFLKPIDTYPLIKDVFHLTYATNTGAAFSILRNHTWILTLVSILAVAGFGFLLFYEKKAYGSTVSTVALAFIIGGSLGNLYDRLLQGYVIDFFDFRLINFAIFNVADSFIVIGMIILLIAAFFLPHQSLLK